MFWFGFDDARRHLFVWNIILKHDVVINYQRNTLQTRNCVHFLLPRNRHSETQIDWQFFLGFICVGQAISWVWLNPFESSHATPTFEICRFSQDGQDLQVYGINSTICQAKTRDQNANKLRKKVFGQRKTERKKDLASFEFLLCIWLLAIKMKSLEVYCTFNFFLFDAIKYWEV